MDPSCRAILRCSALAEVCPEPNLATNFTESPKREKWSYMKRLRYLLLTVLLLLTLGKCQRLRQATASGMYSRIVARRREGAEVMPRQGHGSHPHDLLDRLSLGRRFDT